jgi:SpoVK/Ycf46/Vps4 family AAA+-type ATPase
VSCMCKYVRVLSAVLTCATLAHAAAKREGFATVPDVNWEDVGSLGNIREELRCRCPPRSGFRV